MKRVRCKLLWRDGVLKPPWTKPQLAIAASSTSVATVRRIHKLVNGLRLQVGSSVLKISRKATVWCVISLVDILEKFFVVLSANCFLCI